MTSMTTFAVERRALARRLFDDSAAALELIDVYAGDRLGLYAALVRHTSLSAAQLARETGVDIAFVQHWLERQAGAGFIASTSDSADTPRYQVPGPHRQLLAGADRHALSTPVALVIAGMVRAVPHLLPPGDPVARR